MATALVDLFRLDLLFPVADGKGAQEFISKFPWLAWPDLNEALFIGNGPRSRSMFLDIYHVVRDVFEDEIAGNPNPTFSITQYGWEESDPLSDVFLAYFGSYPANSEVPNACSEMVEKNLRGKRVRLRIADEIDPDALKVVTPSVLTTLQMDWESIPSGINSGIYVGDAGDFDDVVNFWNLRAAGAELIFYDPTHAHRLEKFKEAAIELFNRKAGRDPGSLRDSIAIWSKEGRAIDSKELKLNDFWPRAVTTGTWGGQDINPARFHIGRAKSVFGFISEDGERPELTLQLPAKPFVDEPELHDQKLVISLSSIGMQSLQDESTFRVPFLPRLNRYYGRRMYLNSRALRIETGGVGIIDSIAKTSLHVKAVRKQELITEIFRAFGMEATTSPPGRIASRLIKQMGGIQGCRVFKIPGVRDLLEEHGPLDPFERTVAIGTICRRDPQTGAPNFADYEGLFIEYRETAPLTPDQTLAFLLKRGVFQVGMTFSCPHCELSPWVSLDDMATETKCDYCGQSFLTTIQLRDRNWKYRRSGLFGRDNNQEGSIPVVVTLQQLDSVLTKQCCFAANMNVTPITARIEACETDFVLLQYGLWDDRVSIAIGECKTRGDISAEDVRKLCLVANVFDSNDVDAFIVFSKLAPFTPDEISLCKNAQTRERKRVIMLSDRELEPYFVYERTAEEFPIKRSASSLSDMAEVTEQVFFDPRPRPHNV